jgi:endonuclease/exonuclease/phosphatase family metal-dependent hydrolase
MKILQLNIWGGRLGAQIKMVINREQPDIVCFQEAIQVPGGRAMLFDELSEIAQDTHFEHTYFTPCTSWSLMNREAHSGLAILSRLPFLETKDTFLHGSLVSQFDKLTMRDNIQNLQHVTVSHEDRPLHVLNYHGHHVREHKDGNDETLRQCRMIAEYVEKLEGRVILCGDFNLKPESESLEQINKLLVNHAKEHKVLTTRTLLTPKTEVCDYIFTSKDIVVQNFSVLDDIASDHKALVVEFEDTFK